MLLVSPYITLVTVLNATNLLIARPACLPNSCISAAANPRSFADEDDALLSLLTALAAAFICCGILFILTLFTLLPKALIAAAADVADVVVEPNVVFNVLRDEDKAATFLVTAGSILKVTFALTLPRSFLICAAICFTFVGPCKLSCAVRLNAIFDCPNY